MLEEALELKYRPQTFSALVGQPVVAQFLSALTLKGIARNVILEGTHGAGKTSAGRIYARALNCLHLPTAGPDAGSPCNTCGHCQLFLQNQFPDFLEKDGASAGRVDNIRELLDVVRLHPLLGRYRVVLLDEVQGVSRQGWDALLKVIEESPSHLVWIFATTELPKVRPAIVSRCRVLHVSLLDQATSVAHLRQVAAQEGVIYEPSALELLSFISKGHPRDLLTNLEQAMVLGEVTVANVKALFSLGYVEQVRDIFVSLLQQRVPDAVAVLRGWGEEPAQILEIFREFWLWLLYRHVHQESVVVNPVFGFLPDAEVHGFMRELTRVASVAGVAPPVAVAAVVRVLAQGVAPTRLALDLLLHELSQLMHVAQFDVVRAHKAKSALSVGIGKPGRVFTREFTPDQPVVDVLQEDPVDLSLSTPLLTTPVPGVVPVMVSNATANGVNGNGVNGNGVVSGFVPDKYIPDPGTQVHAHQLPLMGWTVLDRKLT